MQVGYEKALKAFMRLRKDITAPSLHPFYIMADSRRSQLLKPKFFIYQEEEELFYHGFHISYLKGTGYCLIQSPLGYGGPVASCTDPGFLRNAWEEYYNWCLDNKVIAELIRFHPLLENWCYYNGLVTDNRETVWIDLHSKPLMPTYSARARTAIRKAKNNGLKVEWWPKNTFLAAFAPLYQQIMTKLKVAEDYILPDAYFEKLLRWNKAQGLVCLKEGGILGGAVLLLGGELMEYHLSASTLAGKKMGASNLLVHEAALLGQRKGCNILHLGGGTDNSPDNSLLFFKAGFSDNRARFKIGTYIYNPELYEEIKAQGFLKNNEILKRIDQYQC